MSNDRKQLRELHGIGSSSSRGTKRAAELHNASRPYDMGNNIEWSSKPTTIPTPGGQGVRRPNQVLNPYSGRNLRDSMGSGTSNPSARMTITDAPPPKKQKVSGGGFDESESRSRFFMKEPKRGDLPSFKEPRAIPSTVPANTNSLRNAVEGSRSRLGESSFRNKTVAPLSMKPRSSEQEIISIDDSESERDVWSGVPRSASSVLDSRDELDLIGGPSRSPVLPHKPTSNGKLSNGRMVDVQEGSSYITPSKRQTLPANNYSSASRERSRRLAEDGESTKRLNNKLSARLPPESPTPNSVPISPELVPDDEVVIVDEVEEIEDADGFPDTPRATSSKNHIEVQTQIRQVNRAPTPGSSSIKPGTVKQRADEFEEKGKKVLKHYSDLTMAGPQKKSVIGNMKGKDKSISVTNRRKASSSRTIGPSLDRLATAQTNYTEKLALPLEICVWGNRIYRLDREQTDPDNWLYWNKDASELQLHKHPMTNISKKNAIHSIKFSLLKECHPTISGDPDFHLVRFQFDKDFDQSVPEDIMNNGFAFKFLSRHSNMTNWDSLFTRIKDLARENRRQVQHVIGAGTRACLESALQSTDVPVPKPRSRGKETKDTNRSTRVDPTVVDDTDAPIVERKKQPRPRPANRKNQNIDEMFSVAVPTRRSTRLSSEARKPCNEDVQDTQDKEETPPANLDEIVLVYPPSGQGAVNITNGDLRRLQPSEFLNDTIIELGLKFWLNDLRAEQPELADDIHVFSSFFFKKLASRSNKTPEDGHKSVRKWTAKVDIFKKKYIIVPINENIHWYLAIIYHPEHILEPPLPKPTPRTSKRVSDPATRMVTRSLRKDNAAAAVNTDKTGSVSLEGTIENREDTPATWENNLEAAEVEKELMNDTDGTVVQGLRRCSLDESYLQAEHSTQPSGDDVSTRSLSIVEDEVEHPEPTGKVMKPDPAVVEDSLSEGSDGMEVDQLDEDDVPTTSQAVNSTATTPPPTLADVKMDLSSPEPEPDVLSPMDVDDPSKEAAKTSRERSMSDDDLGEREEQASRASSTSKTQGETTEAAGAIPSTSFYGNANQRTRTYKSAKRILVNGNKGQSNPASDVDELDMLGNRDQDANRGSSEELEVTQRSRTIIFCMDSLGSAHPRALSRLNEYLQEEAKDKKGIQNPSAALMKKALVPVQPNFCDCGLYLLHFAKTFMTDPKKYKEVIFAPKKMTTYDRNELWHNYQVATMRERMRDRILTESEAWKRLKAEKEQKQKSLENKDKDIVSNVDNSNGTGQASANQTEQSDDEIEVFEVRHVGPSPSPKKQPAARAKSTANPAARLR